MKSWHLRITLLILLTITLSFIPTPTLARTSVIAEVNGKEIDSILFNRLYKAREEDYKKKLDYNLYSTKDRTMENYSNRRSAILKQAIVEKIKIDEYDLDRELTEFVKKEGGVKVVKLKAEANNTSIGQIKRKLKENLVLEAHFNKHEKEKLIALLINEEIILQEATKRGISASYTELQKALNTEKTRLGGEEAFLNYLALNNATEQDALRELKKGIIYKKFILKLSSKAQVSEKEVKLAYKANFKNKELSYDKVKSHIYKNIKNRKADVILKSFLTRQRNKSSVIIYNNYLDSALAYSLNKEKEKVMQSVKQSKNPFEEDFLKSYFNKQ